LPLAPLALMSALLDIFTGQEAAVQLAIAVGIAD
jgi:hypothetical protein